MRLSWDRAAVGLILVALGVFWFLENLGVVTLDLWDLVGRYWPLILVFLGLGSVLPDRLRGRPVSLPERFGGLFLILIGLLFLADNLGWLGGRSVWALFWPMLLILIGLQSLLPASGGAAVPGAGARSEGSLFSSVQRSPIGELLPVSYWSGFGTIRLDLTRVVLPPGETVVALNTWFGSSEVLVPNEMAVAVSGGSWFGSATVLGERRSGFGEYRVESPGYQTAERRLHLVIHTGFGSAEVHRWH